MNTGIWIRVYRTEDASSLTALFYDTVHRINAKDYTREQIMAWAPDDMDPEEWDRSLSSHISYIAMSEDKIVGFGDIDAAGYLDRLYVHADYQRMGVGSALCETLERAVSAAEIITHASATAKPFFENRGYYTVKEQQVMRRGVWLTNYVMVKR